MGASHRDRPSVRPLLLTSPMRLTHPISLNPVTPPHTVPGRSQSRQPPLFPPSLTLSGFPRSEADVLPPALTHVLRSLLPIFVDVSLSLPMLNTGLFAPESRDESLHAGLLQLPAGTTVLLSESGVQEGKISEAGSYSPSPLPFPHNLSGMRNIRGEKYPGTPECTYNADCRLSLPLCCALPVPYRSLLHRPH